MLSAIIPSQFAPHSTEGLGSRNDYSSYAYKRNSCHRTGMNTDILRPFYKLFMHFLLFSVCNGTGRLLTNIGV
jgi:hypothetical protein